MAAQRQDLDKRLLRDIAELQTKPYPNIKLHIHDEDLSTACLILTPEGWIPLHLTVNFQSGGRRYPLQPPEVRMDSKIDHPNVFNTYICASILNTTEGYTPAYTFKGIAIQLLSFFGSDSIQQAHGSNINLDSYRQFTAKKGSTYQCDKCLFSQQSQPAPSVRIASPSLIYPPIDRKQFFMSRLPNEVLLKIIDYLDFEDLISFTRAWSRVSRLVTIFNIIRNRELQCFFLKENFLQQKLGIGIHLSGNGRQRRLESEFDLISQKAFGVHGIRRSVQGLAFERWLPLPISQGHWRRVQGEASAALARLCQEARIANNALVIYAFMNDIVARLNADLERQASEYTGARSSLRHASEKAIESYFHLFHLLLCFATSPDGKWIIDDANRMIQTFISGKTSKDDIPNLGNLLIALLISDTEPTERLMRIIVQEAITRNVVWLVDAKGAGMAELAYLETDQISHYRLRKTFQGSRVSYRILMFSELFRRTARPSPPARKKAPSPPSTKANPRPSASAPKPNTQKRSYSSVAAASTNSANPSPSPPNRQLQPPSRKTLTQLRDSLFATHGAPPRSGTGGGATAAHLAAEVRRIQQIDDFPAFLKEMGVSFPGRAVFTAVLRETMRDSADKGYHVWRPGQDLVAALRIVRDKSVDPKVVAADLRRLGLRVPGPSRVDEALRNGRFSFFPGRG